VREFEARKIGAVAAPCQQHRPVPGPNRRGSEFTSKPPHLDRPFNQLLIKLD